MDKKIYIAGPIQIFSLDKKTRHCVDRPALQQENQPLFENKLGLSLPMIGNYTVAVSVFQMQKSGFISLKVQKGFN